MILRDSLFIKYSLSGIYGPYVKFAKDRLNQFPDWYKGPARRQDKLPPSISDLLFSRSNRYKGKFLPIPFNSSNRKPQLKSSPGPTTYFNNSTSQSNHNKNPLIGFLSSTERFSKNKSLLSYPGPASYQSHACSPICSKKKQIHQINS